MVPTARHSTQRPDRHTPPTTGDSPSIPVQRGPVDGDVPISGPISGPISVLAILRREGYRVPHAADGPLRPRTHHLPAVDRGAA
ncbi:MAG: hypothetical protein AB7J32_12885, partial [Pseudonocardia sp.]